MGDFKYFIAVAIIGNLVLYLYNRNKKKKTIEKYSDQNVLNELKTNLLNALNKTVNNRKFTEIVHGYYEHHETNIITYTVRYDNYLLAFHPDNKNMAMYKFKKDFNDGITYEFNLSDLVDMRIESLKNGGKLLKFTLTGQAYAIDIRPQTTIKWYEEAAKVNTEGAIFMQETEIGHLFNFLENKIVLQ